MRPAPLNPTSPLLSALRPSSAAPSSTSTGTAEGGFAQALQARRQAPANSSHTKPKPPGAPNQQPREHGQAAARPAASASPATSAQDKPEGGKAQDPAQPNVAIPSASPATPAGDLSAATNEDQEEADALLLSGAGEPAQIAAAPFPPQNVAVPADPAGGLLSQTSAHGRADSDTATDTGGSATRPWNAKSLADQLAASMASGADTYGKSRATADTPVVDSFGVELQQAQHALQASIRTEPLRAPAELVPLHPIRTAVASPGWADEVGQHLSWVAQHDGGRAELVLTPAHLGKIEVSIQMHGDQATASFIAANPAAREALQDSLPRLREMLDQAGIQLGQANVGTSNGEQAHAEPRRFGASFATTTDARGDDSAALPLLRGAVIRSGDGLVDTFA